MTYEEVIEKVHAIMKYCIDVGMNVDVILELNRVIIDALEKTADKECSKCQHRNRCSIVDNFNIDYCSDWSDEE